MRSTTRRANISAKRLLAFSNKRLVGCDWLNPSELKKELEGSSVYDPDVDTTEYIDKLASNKTDAIIDRINITNTGFVQNMLTNLLKFQ